MAKLTTKDLLPISLPSISLDIEARGLKPYNLVIWSLTLTFSKNFPIKKFAGKSVIYHNCNGMKRNDIPAEVVKLIESGKYVIIIHSSEYDGPAIKLVLGINIPLLHDSQLSEVVLQGIRTTKKDSEEVQKAHSSKLLYVKPRYGYKALDKSIREEFIDRPLGQPFSKEALKYMVEDTDKLGEIRAKQFLSATYNDFRVIELENMVARKVINMRVGGIGFDSDLWKKIAEESKVEYDKRIKALPKKVSNWNSPAQVKIYFQSIGVPLTTYDDIYKVYLQTRNKTLAKVIWAKELASSITKFGLSWFDDGYIDEDGRIRPSIDQIVDTGRMSVSSPPLQQMPGVDIKNQQKRLAIERIIEQLKLTGRLIPQHRRAFIPAKGKIFVIGDFSGQEMGIMAAASGEELWINAMLQGQDIHAITAATMYVREWPAAAEKGCKFPFKCTCKEHKNLRETAKILNFMLAYGGGAEKFANDTGRDVVEATMIVAMYKKALPKVTAWLSANGREGVNTGWICSADPYRRKRRLHGTEEWHIRNQAKNTPVQAAGGNMIKRAMINIPDKWHIPLVVHDEILLEVNISEAKEAAREQKRIMEEAADYITGIPGLVKVEPRIAKSWMKSDDDLILGRDGKFKVA